LFNTPYRMPMLPNDRSKYRPHPATKGKPIETDNYSNTLMTKDSSAISHRVHKTPFEASAASLREGGKVIEVSKHQQTVGI
jgi:hypothetical protein